MRPADERFSASVMTRISIRLSFVGTHVDCRMKMSRPRTFSRSSTITSPSEKRPTTQRPRLMLRWRQTASASLGFALPVKTLIRSKAIYRNLRGGAEGKKGSFIVPQKITADGTYTQWAGPAGGGEPAQFDAGSATFRRHERPFEPPRPKRVRHGGDPRSHEQARG